MEDEKYWIAIDLTINGLWGLAFLININRVDLIKGIGPSETARAYLRSPFLIPDLISLVGSVAFIIADKPIISKYFELIRFFSLNKALYPVN